jgi:hypothetical protein
MHQLLNSLKISSKSRRVTITIATSSFNKGIQAIFLARLSIRTFERDWGSDFCKSQVFVVKLTFKGDASLNRQSTVTLLN